MSYQPQCPQCLFVSQQLGRHTPCLLHLDPREASDKQPPSQPVVTGAHDEPYAFGQIVPTTDRPAPFSLLEFARLLLLRSRVQEERAGGLPQPEREPEPA